MKFRTSFIKSKHTISFSSSTQMYYFALHCYLCIYLYSDSGKYLYWKQTESGPKWYSWVGNVWGKQAKVGEAGAGQRAVTMWGGQGEKREMRISDLEVPT